MHNVLLILLLAAFVLTVEYEVAHYTLDWTLFHPFVFPIVIPWHSPIGIVPSLRLLESDSCLCHRFVFWWLLNLLVDSFVHSRIFELGLTSHSIVPYPLHPFVSSFHIYCHGRSSNPLLGADALASASSSPAVLVEEMNVPLPLFPLTEKGPPSWIMLCHQYQVDHVGVVEIHVEQPNGQLRVPSMLLALSCHIILGLSTVPLVNEMECFCIVNLLLWAWNWDWGSFYCPLYLPFPFDSSINYFGVWKLERVRMRLLSDQIA